MKNFRNFPHFELHNLGRLNLLVGTNNSGKTSVLEAIRLLCSQNDLQPLIDTTRSRGEYFYDDHKQERELDIRHLFHNHKIEPCDQFSVSGLDENGQEEELRASIGVHHEDEQFDGDDSLSDSEDNLLDDFQALDFRLEWISGEEYKHWKRPLSSNGGLSYDYFRRLKAVGALMGALKKSGTKTQFITSAALTASEMVSLFDQVVLTDEEDLVVEALQTIEPRIIRIAPLSSERYKYSEAREGFMIRFSDSNQRIPIGSMGDGIWRILGLALATVDAANGVLLVDEIDTGLHFTAMSDMWKLVWETAKRLNVQVFATTHSNDCWTSLATIANEEDTTEHGITIQRIEKNKEIGVAFSEDEIVTAANRGIEVR
ncbi:AAA family ATPase [Euhalothece natronophila]|uniref:AAA family ATPase n=1 Tax=Euhalothece natronophila TaxID=577489 RepID=UPI001FEA5E0F|nr:ATP-binding protein [Euhalothece natronophila]